MTFLTQPVETPATASPVTAAAGEGRFRTRTAALLSALARRIERGADVRARRKAAQMSAAELARLPESVRVELGVNVPGAGGASPFLQGLAGPTAFWGPATWATSRGDAKN